MVRQLNLKLRKERRHLVPLLCANCSLSRYDKFGGTNVLTSPFGHAGRWCSVIKELLPGRAEKLRFFSGGVGAVGERARRNTRWSRRYHGPLQTPNICELHANAL
jgi:hypothetical protein